MELDFSHCRLAPFKHQREDVTAMINHPWFFIASEMRTGKTKIVIDAAQFLFHNGIIDRMIVVTPAPVRDVWFDPKLGELAKHLWTDTSADIFEYHAVIHGWNHGPSLPRKLKIYITNFEFLRSKMRLKALLQVCGQRVLLVGDESSYLKNWQAQQTKAFLQLRRSCGRVVLLNGTPIFHSPLDLFSQGNILHRTVLDCPFITHYKARYAIQDVVRTNDGEILIDRHGRPIRKVNGWTNLEDIQRRFAPITVRRLQKECLDLPPKLDPVMLTATLSDSWSAYCEMKKEMVVWLTHNTVATSATAAVKAIRLSQITSGFLGGVEGAGTDAVEEGFLESLDLGDYDSTPNNVVSKINDEPIQFIGREKLDVLLWFIEQQLETDPNLHLVVWCRFRAELARIIEIVTAQFPQFATAVIRGGQPRQERMRALQLLHPETSPKGPVFVCGIEGTGSFGLNMTAAHTCVTMSSGYSPGRSAQTLDRVYGPGQTNPIAYFNILAVGPKGQRTIDHKIEEARRNGQNVASWTSDAWVKALTEE